MNGTLDHLSPVDGGMPTVASKGRLEDDVHSEGRDISPTQRMTRAEATDRANAEAARESLTFGSAQVRKALGLPPQSGQVQALYPTAKEIPAPDKFASSPAARAMAMTDPHGNIETWHQMLITFRESEGAAPRVPVTVGPVYLPPSKMIDIAGEEMLGKALMVSCHPTEYVAIFEKGEARIAPCAPPATVMRADSLMTNDSSEEEFEAPSPQGMPYEGF